jgi:hypothetical protein
MTGNNVMSQTSNTGIIASKVLPYIFDTCKVSKLLLLSNKLNS